MSTAISGIDTITKFQYDNLIRSYQHAIKYKLPEFEWYNETVLTSYAKYLIEYLDSKFKNMK